MYDVIVAGGGPVGSSAARFCAERGLKTLLIEEHSDFGRPVQCAGLLSSNAFFECSVSDKSVLNEVSSAKVVSGKGSELLFDAKKTMAYVVDRSALDFEMAKNAAKSGVFIKVKTSVTGFCGNEVMTSGANGRESFKCRMVIAADGPRSIFSRILNMKRAELFLSGIQAEISTDIPKNIVELHPYASPEFFGWVIPTQKGFARVGLCGERDVFERFMRFIKPYNSSCVHLVSGTIPLGIMPKTYGSRVLFCGDAAGFAKPTSGGGVYTGIRTAFHAAETALKCCESGRFSDSDLADYEKRWKADIGGELSAGMALYKMRQKVSDERIDALCRCMNNPKILDDIVKYGDMDRPQALIKKLFYKPCVIRALGGILGDGLLSLLPGPAELKK
ncbi:MAG: NAD(P)/FAD-dependent oxidoreductase [Methanomicrobium sp.]|nr:NAD(P)/FAD-dependent oxidoreductase [Methanomicrobium sp.]